VFENEKIDIAIFCHLTSGGGTEKDDTFGFDNGYDPPNALSDELFTNSP